MDIRFLKNLTPNVGYLFPKSRIILTPTPAVDIVNVGVSQIVRNHAIFVPIYGHDSCHLEKKVIPQTGGSLEKITTKELNATIEKDQNREIEKLVNLKRKLTDGIEASFLHPKIKTSSLQLTNTSVPKKAKHNYKFKIVD